ncbi:hypothetical protein OEZ86_003880 [Tetradesmus obliquus]|nr:hypothetical protein OEZ86_003880 [Tetradesmus obliquus]
MGCDAKGMWQGSVALQNLSCAIASHLISPQQQQQSQQQQQQQEESDAASPQQDQKQFRKKRQQQQQQQQRGSEPDVSLLQLPPPAVLRVLSDLAALSQGSDKQSKQGRAYADVAQYLLDAQVPTQQQQQQQQQQYEPLLFSWHVPELLRLYDQGGPVFDPESSRVNAKLSAAAAHNVQQLAAWINSSSSSSSSSGGGFGSSSSSSSSSSGVIGRKGKGRLNLYELRLSLTGQTLSSEADSEYSDEPPDSSRSRLQQLLLSGGAEQLQAQLAAVADFTWRQTHYSQYHPSLLDSVGQLLVVLQDTSCGSSSSSNRLQQQQQQRLYPEKLAKLVHSLAMFNHCSADAALAVQRLTAAALPSMHCSAITIARLAWGLSVLNQRDASLWRSIQQAIQYILEKEWRARLQRVSGGKARAAAETRSDIWGKGSMFQLYQAGLFFEHCVGGMGPLVQPAWSGVVTRGWEAATKLVSVSGIQRSVAHAISSLQARPLSQVRRYEIESRTRISSVDILVAVGEARVVVEVDGPFHYASNSTRKRLGNSDLRDLLLRQQGFRVLPLPYYEWQKLPSDKATGNLTKEGLAKFEAWLLAAAEGKQLW